MDINKLCPRCQAPLAYRLGEFECTSCGYFERAGNGEEHHTPAQGAPGGSPALHTGRDVEANVPDSGLHSGVVWHRTADQAAAGLAKHKLVFLITLFVVTEIGNIALAWANPSFAPSLRAWGVLLFSALVLTGVAALLLYIDWHVAKIGGMGLVLIAECGYFYGLYQAWHGDSQLYLLRLGVDILLLAWLWVLLLVDWRTNY